MRKTDNALKDSQRQTGRKDENGWLIICHKDKERKEEGRQKKTQKKWSRHIRETDRKIEEKKDNH